MKEYKLLLNNNWQEGNKIRKIKSPYNNKEIAQVHFADECQMTSAVFAAHKAYEKTHKLSCHERSTVLEKISNTIERRLEELAESIALCAGKTIKSSRVEVSRAVNTFKIASEEAKRMNGEIISLDLSPQT